MKSLVPAAALMLVAVQPCLAQDVVPDTLDAQGYFPLEIGNAWEWVLTDPITMITRNRRLEIIGDTLVEELIDDTYVVEVPYVVARSITDYGAGSPMNRASTLLFRWHDLRDILITTQDDGPETTEYHDLGAAFGSEYSYGIMGDMMHVGGGYADQGACLQLGSRCAPFAAEKTFGQYYSTTAYYHGIGPVYLRYGMEQLVYASIGGEEYGAPVIAVGTDEGPRHTLAEVSIYPNPARARAWLALPQSFETPNASVYDLLGREVVQGRPCHETPCMLDLDRLPPGPYFVRVEMRARADRWIPVQVVR